MKLSSQAQRKEMLARMIQMQRTQAFHLRAKVVNVRRLPVVAAALTKQRRRRQRRIAAVLVAILLLLLLRLDCSEEPIAAAMMNQQTGEPVV